MKGAIAVSAAAHLVIITASHMLGHRFHIVSPREVMDVSLVSAPPAVEPTPPAAARPAPERAEKVLPDVAEQPTKKRDLEKRVTDKKKQAVKKLEKKAPPKEEPEEQPESTSTEVSATGAAPQGAAIGEIRLDTSSFQYAYYLTALRNKVASHWAPGPLTPGSSSRVATVYFRISRDGSLHEVEVETSSGNTFFDQSALRAVYGASPVAPLPFGFSEGSLGVHFDFRQNP